MRNLLLALIPMSFGFIPFCQVSAAEMPATIKFDHQKWIEFKDRKAMAFDLVDSRSLIGKTKEQVWEMLGKPYNDGGKDLHFYSFNAGDSVYASHRAPTIECLELKYSQKGIVKNNEFSTCPYRLHCSSLKEGDPIPDAN